MRLPRPSLALVIASLALLLAASGASFAAVRSTGSLVNVTDPVNAEQVARVDATGHLFVGDGSGALSVDGSVSAEEILPRLPFSRSAYVIPNNSRTVNVLGPTTATLAVSDLRIANYANSSSAFVQLYSFGTDSTNQICDPSTGYKYLGAFAVGVSQTVVETFSTPLVIKPFTAGKGSCLAADAQTRNSSNVVGLFVSVSGWNVAGSYTP